MAKKIYGATIGNRPLVADSSDIFIDIATEKQYVYEDGAWHELPYNGQDLSSYIKNTDYAKITKAGVVKVGAGLSITQAGVLSVTFPEALPLCEETTTATYTLKCTVTAPVEEGGTPTYAYAWVADASDTTE